MAVLAATTIAFRHRWSERIASLRGQSAQPHAWRIFYCGARSERDVCTQARPRIVTRLYITLNYPGNRGVIPSNTGVIGFDNGKVSYPRRLGDMQGERDR